MKGSTIRNTKRKCVRYRSISMDNFERLVNARMPYTHVSKSKLNSNGEAANCDTNA